VHEPSERMYSGPQIVQCLPEISAHWIAASVLI
jgi:hypothetical protein